MLLFNRPIKDKSWIAVALKALVRSSAPEDRALASNLMYDDRVSANRAKTLRSLFNKVLREGKPPFLRDGKRLADGLKHALHLYHITWIRTQAKPAFTNLRGNSVNSVSQDALPPNDQLINILNVSSLAPFYKHIQASCNSEQLPIDNRLVRTVRNNKDYSLWVDSQLRGKPDGQRRDFVNLVLKAMRECLADPKDPLLPHHPTWLIPREDLEHIWQSPAGDWEPSLWAEAAGLNLALQAASGSGQGPWLALLSVDFREVRDKIYRPTQLDAGGDYVHVPSPALAPPDSGGHPLDLTLPLNYRSRLRREFIHPQIHSMESLKVLAVEKVRFSTTVRNVAGELFSLRSRHRVLLADRYQDLSSTWLPNGA